METKIDIYKTLTITFTILVMLSATQFFFITQEHYQLIAYISVFSCIFLFVKLKEEEHFLFSYVLFFLLLIFLTEIVITVYRYNLSPLDVFYRNSYLMILCSYFLFAYLIRIFNRATLLNILMLFSLGITILLFVQYFLFNRYGLFIYINRLDYRFGHLRLTQGEGLINIMVVVAFGHLLNNTKEKFLPLLTFLLGFLELLLIQKTRMAILCVLLSCLFMLFIKIMKNKSMLILFLVGIGVLTLVYKSSSLLSQYVNSVSSNDLSYTARNYEMDYYIDQFKDHKIFGMGFPEDNSSLVRGIFGYYYKDDVGIVGFLNTFGIIGVLWYAVLLLQCVYHIIRGFISKTINNHLEVLGLFLFVAVTSGTLIITDPQRIIGLAIILALVDSLYCDTKTVEKGINHNSA